MAVPEQIPGQEYDYEALPSNYGLGRNMLAGAFAGIMEHAVMYPVDLLKTRMQVLHPTTGGLYTGLTNAVSTIYRIEGWRTLWKGVSSVIVGAGPAHAVYFGTYEVVKEMAGGNVDEGHHPLAAAASGAAATIASDALMNPFDVIKQRMQVHGSVHKSLLQCATSVYRAEGLHAFYVSYPTTLCMTVPFTATQFVAYESISKVMNPSHEYDPFTHCIAGGLAGAFAAGLTTPLDVVKTLLQTRGLAQNEEIRSARGLFNAAAIIKRQFGWRGFLRGARPRIISTMPSTAICWTSYEMAKAYFKRQELTAHRFYLPLPSVHSILHPNSTTPPIPPLDIPTSPPRFQTTLQFRLRTPTVVDRMADAGGPCIFAGVNDALQACRVFAAEDNNEDEALRAWRSALDTISYHNAYRLSSTYTPKNETEKALQDSIRQLELQCRERVDLLEALRESRKEAQEKDSPTTSGISHRFFKGKSASKPPTSNTPGWIGDGTVPPVDYTDLSRPPPIPGRPAPVTQGSSESVIQDSSVASATSLPALRIPSHSSAKNQSRNSSPEKRKTMPTTLRKSDGHKKHSKNRDTLRRKDLRPAASQAAGLAWGNIYRLPSASGNLASDAAATSSRQSISSDSGFRKDSGQFRSHSGDELVSKKNVADDSDGREPRPGWSARRTNSNTIPVPTLTSIHHSPAGEARQPSGSRSRTVAQPSSGPVDNPQSSARPSVRPKPVALRASPQDPQSSNVGPTSSPVRKTRPETTTRISDDPQRKATSGSRVNSASTGKPVSRTQPEDLSPSMRQLEISDSSIRRKPQPAHTVTPPSSDQESTGPKSIDADEELEEEGEDEDGSITSIMNKLPKGIDPNAARQILNDIVVRGDEVHWDDIAGLDAAKKALKEAVVYPFLRPDLFSGLREPARGMLLFGPPGTGKTMLARAVATESKSTFFSVSASTLTSKWHGESEKLVRALFGLAKALAPSIIFVDEIDSLLSSRSSGTENEASRRSKTEFLIQWSDLQRAAAGREPSTKRGRGDPSQVLVLAATNMPWDIDEAARRRFVRRQYIPLPEHHVRDQQLRKLLSHQVHELDDEDIEVLVHVTEGFSGSDITALAKDAAMGPLRNLGEALLHTPMDQIRPIRFHDFEASLKSIRPSVSRDGLREYEEWARKFGERGG
ncbi:hypothetical protein KXX13_004361 [Aspergillus fumigatus]|nr:hypothetical protein KXX13_004361 [Aspergillus fumigatus]KAH1520753.1 hypothetical protein KXX29_004177 [Aspergillus fumigatus]KAH1924894.1 hypothetical protein KXW69_008571 [Aspergillus fumigatus]KAH2093568.1 hypothetical protein KXW32_007232 [Aspergillus fumigatus]KAH2418926.1 hypothetical protein KXV44_008282 [Aspergillus fumigatus]